MNTFRGHPRLSSFHGAPVWGAWSNVTTVMGPGGESATMSEGGGIDSSAAASAGSSALSSLSDRGSASSKKGVRAASAAGKTVAGGAGVVGTAVAAGLPLNAVPIAGQIAFAAVVVGAATFAFIAALRRGRLTNAQVDKLAKKYGISSDLKHYVRKVMRMSKAKRKIELAKEKKRSAKKKKGGLHALGRSKKRLTEKLDVIKQVVAFDKAEAQAAAKAKAAGASDAEIASSTMGSASSGPEQLLAKLDDIGEAVGISGRFVLPLGLSAIALALFFLFKRSRS